MISKKRIKVAKFLMLLTAVSFLVLPFLVFTTKG